MIKLNWKKDKNEWSGFLWPMFKIYGYYINGKYIQILTILESKRKPRHFKIDSIQQGKIIANMFINQGKFPSKVKELNLKIKESQ